MSQQMGHRMGACMDDAGWLSWQPEVSASGVLTTTRVAKQDDGRTGQHSNKIAGIFDSVFLLVCMRLRPNCNGIRRREEARHCWLLAQVCSFHLSARLIRTATASLRLPRLLR